MKFKNSSNNEQKLNKNTISVYAIHNKLNRINKNTATTTFVSSSLSTFVFNEFNGSTHELCV